MLNLFIVYVNLFLDGSIFLLILNYLKLLCHTFKSNGQQTNKKDEEKNYGERSNIAISSDDKFWVVAINTRRWKHSTYVLCKSASVDSASRNYVHHISRIEETEIYQHYGKFIFIAIQFGKISFRAVRYGRS